MATTAAGRRSQRRGWPRRGRRRIRRLRPTRGFPMFKALVVLHLRAMGRHRHHLPVQYLPQQALSSQLHPRVGGRQGRKRARTGSRPVLVVTGTAAGAAAVAAVVAAEIMAAATAGTDRAIVATSGIGAPEGTGTASPQV